MTHRARPCSIFSNKSECIIFFLYFLCALYSFTTRLLRGFFCMSCVTYPRIWTMHGTITGMLTQPRHAIVLSAHSILRYFASAIRYNVYYYIRPVTASSRRDILENGQV